MSRRLLYLPFLLLLLLLATCNLDNGGESDCSAVGCEANFQNLYVEVLDSAGQNNLLADGTLTAANIQISGTPTVQFDIGTEFDKEVLIVTDTVWEIGTFNYDFIFRENDSLPVIMTLDRTGGDGCCSNRLFLKALEVDGNSKEVNGVPTSIEISNP